jgi:hypothetical protein
MVVVNALANALPINNKTTGELSDAYPNLFVPAGITFSIWGLIYLLLGVFVVYQLFCAFRDKPNSSFIGKIGPWFILSSLANIAWIFVWHYEMIVPSFFVMLFLLGSLIALYTRLEIGISVKGKTERYLVHLAFSVYLGWITIATIANTTILLLYLNWNTFGLGDVFWTVAVLAVGVVITVAMLFRRRDVFYGVVVVWALLGILLKRLAVDATPIQSVVIAAIAGLVITIGAIITQLARGRVY